MIDRIFYNANILTQDKGKPAATAFAVSDGKIVAVGSDDEILSLQASNTKLESLNNQTVLPGFNDAHIHIWKVGNLMTYLLDLRGVKSIEEMQQLLFDYAKKNPQLEWIQARGFNEALFEDQRMPDRFDLDKVITDKPVCIMRTCAHQIVVNSRALELTGITENTSAPPGGEIKKFNDGKLKGHFTETALGLVMKKIPSYTFGEYRHMILAAQEEFLKAGITSATDPAVMPDLMEVYKQLDQQGELKMRVNIFPIRVPDGESKALPLPEKYHSDHLKIDTVKFFADGGLSGMTAALKHPYKNSGERGILRLQKEFFLPLALEAQQAGFRIATHAIGDEAIDMVMEVYEELAKNDSSFHHRIEHLGLPSTQNLNRMERLKVAAVMQPVFIYELGKNFREYLAEDYLQRLYPAHSVLSHHINLALSTDAPVVKDFNPFTNINSASNRKDAEGYKIAEGQEISVDEAIYAYTMGSAVANGDEKVSGSISPGKYADFIVVSRKPDSGVPGTKVTSTFIGGDRVLFCLNGSSFRHRNF